MLRSNGAVGGVVPGDVLVRFRTGVPEEVMNGIARARGAQIVPRLSAAEGPTLSA